MGWEKADIYLNQGNTYNNISVSNCISIDSLVLGYHLILDPVGSGSVTNNVQEINSMITYQ